MIRIVIEIASSAARKPFIMAFFAKLALKGIVALNRAAIRAGELGPLYSSGVRYKDEPPGVETFRDGVATDMRGHGDCAHLAAWRVAELNERGEKASIRIQWRWSRKRPGTRLYHVVVRRGPGVHPPIEDPSRKLGMK